MSKERAMIHVIDDEEAICEALSSLFRSVDYSVACYSSADRFMEGGLDSCTRDRESRMQVA